MTLKTIIQSYCPKSIYSGLASAYWLVNPYRSPRAILPHDGHWRIWHVSKGTSVCVPNRRHINRGSPELRQRKLERYTCPGFVEVEQGDTVLDIGAFVGEFAIPASKRAKRIISFEPDPFNFACLEHNTENVNNIEANKTLAWKDNETVKFSIGSDASESSAFNVDSGNVEKSVRMDGVRLDNYLIRNNTEKVDLLKLDAEGAEPQVISGLEKVYMKKIAVDCGKEYYGKSTRKKVKSILKERGYSIQNGGKDSEGIVFGKIQP